MDELKAALVALIDERLLELGLVEAATEPAPVKAGKGGKAAKGKPIEPTHTVDELKDQLMQLVKTKNKQAAVDALARFGCKKLADVKPEQQDEFFDYLAEQLGGGGGDGGGELFE